MTTTDLNMIRKKTKLIAQVVKPEDTGLTGIVIHPFLNSSEIFIDGNYINILNKENYDKWITHFSEIIDKSDLIRLYMLWRDPWKLTFMKYCGECLSEKDYAKFLADAWVTEENPNMDCNVSRQEVLKMFCSCKKEYLMEQDDLLYYNRLPQEIELYRGVSKGRIKLGLSWTDDKEKAIWFMNRWDDNKNCLLKVKANKKDIIAYFNTRNESECLLDVFKYKSKIKEVHNIYNTIH